MSSAIATLTQALCLTCGAPVASLPTITPEMLFFKAGRSGEALPIVAAMMPDGSRAVAFGGVIYSMPEAEWAHYLQMRLNFEPLPLDEV